MPEEFNLKKELEEMKTLFDSLVKLPPAFRRARSVENQISDSLKSILNEIEGKEIIISVKGKFSEEDIKLIQERSGVSFEEAKKNLEKADGDLAKAIMMTGAK